MTAADPLGLGVGAAADRLLRTVHRCGDDHRPGRRARGGVEGIAETTRLRLLSLVAAHDGAEACVCDLTDPVGLSQPTFSHHLKTLVDASLLEREQRGRWAYFRLVPDALQVVARLLGGLTR